MILFDIWTEYTEWNTTHHSGRIAAEWMHHTEIDRARCQETSDDKVTEEVGSNGLDIVDSLLNADFSIVIVIIISMISSNNVNISISSINEFYKLVCVCLRQQRFLMFFVYVRMHPDIKSTVSKFLDTWYWF